MKITWSPLAIERVTEIAQYISEHDSGYATELVEKIFNRVLQLETFPESAPIVQDINRTDIRQLLVANYQIMYRIKEEEILVLSVRHDRQIINEIDLE